jgi:hypothetical protein
MAQILRRSVLLFVLLASSFAVFAQSSAPEAKREAAGPKTAPMKSVATDGAPKAIGPYSQAIVEGGFLFAAGQIPLDPKTAELVAGGIEPATERVLDNLEAVLKAEGLSFSDVVKTS